MDNVNASCSARKTFVSTISCRDRNQVVLGKIGASAMELMIGVVPTERHEETLACLEKAKLCTMCKSR